MTTPQRWIKTTETWAVQYTGSISDLPAEWRERGHFTRSMLGGRALRVLTPHGVATCYPGDYIALDAGGGFYPIHRATFEGSYRPAGDDE